MSVEKEPVRACAIAYIHHCYQYDGTASVWALPGLEDSESPDAPRLDEYPNFPKAILLAEKLSNPVAWLIAEAAVQLLGILGIRSKLAVGADD